MSGKNYGVRSSGREHGTVMTRQEVVEFILDASGYTSEANLSRLRVMDPAGGDGVFILEVIRRLNVSSKQHNFEFCQALQNLRVVELDERRCESLKRNVSQALMALGANEDLADLVVSRGDYLLKTDEKFDLVVGNPPYIRHENIPPQKKAIYRKRYRTFRHRSDIYIAFFEKGLQSLSRNGVLCFICSNRWMKARYGADLREEISRSYGVPMIVDLNDADVFDEKVHGYPAIIQIINKNVRGTRHYRISDIRELKDILRSKNKESPYSNVSETKIQSLGTFTRSAVHIPQSSVSIEEQGFKIGIGVATGSDKIFVGKNLPDLVERESLIPILLSKDIKEGVISWSGNYLINPFDPKTGKLISLATYPRLREYFFSNKESLIQRHVAKKNPEKWYKTIDRIYPDLLHRPKLLLPDMKKTQLISLDEGRYYPHHNIYHITHPSVSELKILGAILMSDHVLEQIKDVSTIMHGGFVRWQSQNLRRLLIPRIDELGPQIRDELIAGFDRKDTVFINAVLNEYLLACESRDDSRVSTLRENRVLQTKLDSW